jgi:hypothetical protein
MSCARFDDQVLEHALGEPASTDLDAHLRGCPACRASLEREREFVGRIDTGLREALDVVPGPRLLPRVRQGVSASPAVPAWSLRWMPIAASLIALVATVLLLRGRPEAVPPEQPVARATAVAPRPDAPSPSVAVPAAVPVPVVRPATASQKRPLPEVLVPPGEAELLARYVAAVRARRIEAPPAGVEAARSQEVAIPQLLQLAPLEVTPLTDVNPEGVDHE